MLELKLLIFVENGNCFHQPCFSIFLLIFKACAKFKHLLLSHVILNEIGCTSKSKLAFPKYNKMYFSVIAFVVFILHEIKQRKFFGGHPVFGKSFHIQQA